MTTEPEDELAEYPMDRRLTFEETARYWEENFGRHGDPDYEAQKKVKVYKEGDELRNYGVFESDEEHAQFLAFYYKLRHGEL